MYLQQVKSKNATSLYICESVYTKDKKNTSRVVKKLGTLEDLAKEHDDPIAWAKELAKTMTQEAKEGNEQISIHYDPGKQIPLDQDVLVSVGYLFLQKLYYSLGIDKVCQKIQQKYAFEYDLNDILRTLIYGRILFPSSKASTFEQAHNLLEAPSFEQHDIYRALEVIAKESDFIQCELYKNSKKVYQRRDDILFYDCTNFFFEIEEEDDFRKYGLSKEHRPNPIVQMGLFMDQDGVPLAFSIHPGNTSEQVTLKPLEQQILRDFEKSQFVTCTDAGIASRDNRVFNSLQGRGFITVQSLKKMKGYLKDWALDPEGWHCSGHQGDFNLDEIRNHPEGWEDRIFYKERWVEEDHFSQRFIVTFSLKYMAYQQTIRGRQVERAYGMAERGQVSRKNPNDPARFLTQQYIDEDGVICEEKFSYVDEKKIEDEARYDGFYCSATNLKNEVDFILKVNRQRWEIEESFRILKSEFKARPVFLSRQDRIQAHFTTCFLALYVFRILELELKEEFTCHEIVKTLRSMQLLEHENKGFVPAYKRTVLTDRLHETFGFHTDYEIMKIQEMRKIVQESKKPLKRAKKANGR